ncbi:hypothetical protein GCM10009557_65350 [Virgisporangium ochraceum]|uniref:Lipoprotein n=1 Tax=Virgisporangium ochraceum TaxID=65505 RepID=A0A8J4A1K5_9ACTN|nr:hypothetical protein [Virgisporangium ochraceum]GIJ73531.1 hypothetical protein Voc01_084480 [Virgisporangium ochraceum]
MNGRLALVTVLLLATGGCGGVHLGPDGADPATRPLRCQQPPDQPSGMHVLLAQSVPTASAVPCLTHDVPDWLVTLFEAVDGRARIDLTDRYGRDGSVVVEVVPDCDVGAARETETGSAGVRRYDGDGRVLFVYDGGCTEVRNGLTGARADPRAAEIPDAIGFVTREDLDRQIRAASDGHLHLDAGRAHDRHPSFRGGER